MRTVADEAVSVHMSSFMSSMEQSVQWFVQRMLETVFTSFQSWEQFAAAVARIPGAFLNLSSGLAWPYLLSNLALAWCVYFVAKRSGLLPSVSFRQFAFPARIYRHPSTALDARFMAIELVLSFLVYLPIYTGIGLLWNKIISAVLIHRLSWEPPHSASPIGIVLMSIGICLLVDFINYAGHVWCHRSPWLWSFHEVHHSAEVLTPATAYRVHPLENMLFAFLHAPVFGLGTVLFQNLAGQRQFLMIGGATVIGFLFQSLGAHLKHSHIWLSFGTRLNRVLISPAHHQIHHSVDPRHVNKNFGASLTIWDALFGTLYEPRTPEPLRVGLTGGASRKFATVRELYFRPFAERLASLKTRPEIVRVSQG